MVKTISSLPIHSYLVLLICDDGVFAAEDGRCSVVSLFEEFYEVRDIGKAAIDTYLRYGELGRGEHNFGTHKSLFNNPTMWWHIENASELLFEGG